MVAQGRVFLVIGSAFPIRFFWGQSFLTLEANQEQEVFGECVERVLVVNGGTNRKITRSKPRKDGFSFVET